MLNRRQVLASLAVGGVTTTTFERALAVLQSQSNNEITPEMVRAAAWIAGGEWNEEECAVTAAALERNRDKLKELRETQVDFDTVPACVTRTLAPRKPANSSNPQCELKSTPIGERPADDVELAFLPVTQLAQLIRAQKVTSTELTQLYLARLKRFDPILKCVVNLTEELALRQAAVADQEIAAGKYRGWLHGIPWGAKDLIAVESYPTTWGIPQFLERVISESAHVYQRLEAAGAVLVAKLSLGAIAMGDRWYGGPTRNPWNIRQGSSGSSAGSASAVAAGLVGFALGSETLGSILSPSRRCGTTGFRPTYGRVGRGGCMSLSWSMDKIGPITRSVEDCALIFGAIHGEDPRDPATYLASFNWPLSIDWSDLRVGYTDNGQPVEKRDDLAPLRNLGAQLIAVELPSDIPTGYLTKIIDVEGAAMFEQLLTKRETDGWNEWPRIFRSALLVPALDYLRVQRIRRKLMGAMERVFESVDVMVNVPEIVHTNLTGHPSLVMPVGFRSRRGIDQPYSVVITGRLDEDDKLLAIGERYQQSVSAHLRQPPLDRWLADPERFLNAAR